MLASQMAIEQSIGLGEGPQRPYLHVALSSPGRPILAAAVFGVLQVQTDKAMRETSDELGQWGLTLVPGHDTNTLFLHFPADEGTRVIDMVLPSLAKGRSRVPGKEVTRAILACCYDVVFSEDSWSNLLDHERTEVMSAMTSRSSLNNWTLDIFKGSEWETVPSGATRNGHQLSWRRLKLITPCRGVVASDAGIFGPPPTTRGGRFCREHVRTSPIAINSRPQRDDQQDRSDFLSRATAEDTSNLQCWIPADLPPRAQGPGR